MGIIEDYLIKKYNTNMLIKEYAMLELQIDKLPKYFDKQRFISTTEIEKLINSESKKGKLNLTSSLGHPKLFDISF